MSSPLYILIELSLFFVGIKRLHQTFFHADAFFTRQVNLRREERETLQLAGMHAVHKNLDQARLFFCEREPTTCVALTEKHRRLVSALQLEIASREKSRTNSSLTPVLRKQNPTLRPASWPNWVPGFRYHPTEELL
jgi:hypothetical protein